jgi:protein import protein ZIM17
MWNFTCLVRLVVLAAAAASVSSYRLARRPVRLPWFRYAEPDGGLERMGDDSGVSRITPSSGVSNVEKFLMMYTCKVCDGRNAHMVSKVAYNHGMVVTTCRHCKNRHLIADNEQKLDMGPDTPAYQKVEELLKMRGEKVQKMQVGSKQDLIEGRYLVEQDGDSINVVDLQAAVETLERYERGESRADDETDELVRGEEEEVDDERRLRFITRPIDPEKPDDGTYGRARSNE